jgi:tRNA A-37 threonylcarbamoyl transferase component Bud32
MRMLREIHGGVPVVVKVAAGDAERRRLAHERSWLASAAHPGVVTVVDGAATPDRLVLRDVGGTDLAAVGRLTADELSGLAAAAATTLADLHDLGVAHGSICSSHLLIAGDGTPVWCSFGCAGPVGADREAARADVCALVTTLEACAEALGSQSLTQVLRRAGRGRRPADARQLAALLARATPSPCLPAPGTVSAVPTDGRTRPEPASGAETRAAAPPEPHLPEAAPRRPQPTGPGRRRMITAAGAGLVTVAAVVIVAVTSAAGGTRAAGTRALATGTRATVAPRRVARRRSAARRFPLPCPQADAWCAPLPVTGGLFEADGRRWKLSAPADVVVLGRWDCHTALPAALDPSTGQVWVFARWTRSAGPVTARAVGRVAGASSLRTVPTPDGCDRIAALVAGHPAAVLAPTQSHRRTRA